MKIRLIEPRDDAAVAELVRSSLKRYGLDVPGTAYFDPQLNQLSKFYAEPGRGYYVLVDDDGRVVGGCGFGEYHGQTAELQKLYIDPVAQGQGESRLLIARVEAAARKAGYQRIYLETHHRLSVACQLYPKVGYKRLNGPLQAGPHTAMDRFFRKQLRS